MTFDLPPTPPSESRLTWPTLLSCGLLIILYFLSGIHRPLDLYDEGIPLYGAWRVLHGEIPYRDFWTIYAPGQYYVLALLFKLTGPSILAARIWDCFLRALLTLVAYLFAQRAMRRESALFACAFFVLWLERVGMYSYNAFPALLLSAATLLLFLRLGEATRYQAPLSIACGIGVAASTLFRQDFGLYLLVTLGLLSVLKFCSIKSISARTKLLGAFALMLGSALALLAIVSAFFLKNVSPHDLIHSLYEFPLHTFKSVRALPYPSVRSLLTQDGAIDLLDVTHWNVSTTLSYYFPVLAMLSGALAILWSGQYNQRRFRTLIALFIFGLALANQSRVRSDFAHLFPLYLPSSLLFFAFLELLWNESRPARVVASTIALAVLVPLVSVPLKSKFLSLKSSTESTIERRNGIAIDGDSLETARYVRTHSKPHDSLYVGLPDHRVITRNDVALYFLADRPSATRYHELHPGVTDTIAVQEEMVAALSKHAPQLVVQALPYPFEVHRAPKEAYHLDATLLDAFIAAHYDRVATFGRYVVLDKRR